MKYNLEDLEEIRDYEDTKRFVSFEDKEGKEQLMPYIGEFIVNYVKIVNIIQKIHFVT